MSGKPLCIVRAPCQTRSGYGDMSKTVVYKVEVPANRYDLLCLEGLALAIRYYLGLENDLRSPLL